MSLELIFTPDDHVYRVGGVIKPSVTQILSAVGTKVRDAEGRTWWRGLLDYGFLDAETRDDALARGKFIAEVCALRAQRGALPSGFVAKLTRLHPEWMRYYPGFERFIAETGFQPAADFVERPGYSTVHDYTGTPDLPGLLHGKPALLDIKTGIAPRAVQWQLAGYSLITPAAYLHYDLWAALELHDDGSYKLIPIRNQARARAVWLSILNVYREGIAIHGNAIADAA